VGGGLVGVADAVAVGVADGVTVAVGGTVGVAEGGTVGANVTDGVGEAEGDWVGLIWDVAVATGWAVLAMATAAGTTVASVGPAAGLGFGRPPQATKSRAMLAAADTVARRKSASRPCRVSMGLLQR
jgi:hypothetical protein